MGSLIRICLVGLALIIVFQITVGCGLGRGTGPRPSPLTNGQIVSPPDGRSAVAPINSRVSVAPPSASLPSVVRPGTGSTPERLIIDPAFSQELESFVGRQVGTYGVAIADLNGGVSAIVRGDEVFATASLYKLFLMYAVLRAVNEGTLTLDETVTTLPNYTFPEADGGIPPATTLTVAEAIRRMIEASSNAAALALLDRIGPGALNAVPAQLGLRGTTLAARPSGQGTGHYFVDGTTTPIDLLTFFVALDGARLVSPAADALMQDALLGQQIRDRLPVLLPKSARVAHKTGDLEHSVHDAGIVYVPGRRFVVVVLSKDVRYDESNAVIAEVARAAHERFAR